MNEKLDYKTKKFNRSLYLVFSALCFLLLATTYFDIKSKNDHIKDHIKNMEDNIILQYKERLKESVYSTIFYIDNLYNFYLQKQKDSNSNKLNKEHYKLFENNIREYLYSTVYDNTRYTWINEIKDFNGGDNYAIRLIHPNLKDTEHSFLSTNKKDIKGNTPYLNELNGIKANKEIFHFYYFEEYLTHEKTEKLTYAKLYEKLNWVIAAGIPLNKLKKQIKQQQDILIKEYNKLLIITISIKIIILLILASIVYILKEKISTFLFKNLTKSYNDLKYSNEKLNVATKSAHIGIWKWDIVKNHLEWDNEMYKIYEITPNKALNNYELWYNSLYDEDKEKAQEEVNNAIKDHKLFSSIFRIKTKSGLKYIRASGKVSYDNKTPIYMVGTNVDITLEKKQEELIKKQSESISKHIIYLRTDLQGLIVDVSDSFCDISGYKKEELLGKAHNIIKNQSMSQKTFTELGKNINSKNSWQGEIKNKRKDGSYYWVFVDISPEYDVNNKLIGYISTQTDITINKKLEEKQLQFLEQAKMASLGEMIGNIAHQWRQPLSVISVASTGIRLQKEAGILNDEILYEELDSINNTAQYLSETINTFRDFIKEGKVYKEIILQDRIKEIIKLLKATLKNNHITLINNIEKEKEIKIHVIVGELSQVIINVINNSKDAFKENMTINPFIKLDVKKDENNIILTIEDNAGGIPENIIPRIFEPYFTTKYKSQGTGLGLYMSHKIITDSLKGKIYAKNSKNGVIFYIELPLKKNN